MQSTQASRDNLSLNWQKKLAHKQVENHAIVSSLLSRRALTKGSCLWFHSWLSLFKNIVILASSWIACMMWQQSLAEESLWARNTGRLSQSSTLGHLTCGSSQGALCVPSNACIHAADCYIQPFAILISLLNGYSSSHCVV